MLLPLFPFTDTARACWLSPQHSFKPQILCPALSAAGIRDAVLFVLGKDRAQGCSVELGLQGSNSKTPLELCFLPSNPEVWLSQSSRRLGGKRGSSQGGEKMSPGSINIHRCSLAATAHTKAPLHLQGCHEGSAHCSAKPGKRRRLRPLPAALWGGKALPQLPRMQPWCPAHLCALPGASPSGTGTGAFAAASKGVLCTGINFS